MLWKGRKPPVPLRPFPDSLRDFRPAPHLDRVSVSPSVSRGTVCDPSAIVSLATGGQ